MLAGQLKHDDRRLPVRVWIRRSLAGAVVAAMLAGCSPLTRTQFDASDQARAEVAGLEGVRIWADAPLEDGLAKWLPRSRKIVLLALSGGADSGAYGAGFLNGWTASGARPSFSVVSGVSTGALIAPFAFLGPEYDPALRRLYTETSARDVFVFKPALAGLLGPSLADTKPLERHISRLITPELLDAIAREHERGRRLFVVTTNLDAQRTVIWNMGEIAARKQPNSLALFRQVMLASASIPGVFPPVLIEVEVDGRRFREMHADGGTTTQILTVVEPVLTGENRLPADRSLSIYAIFNKNIEPEFKVTRNWTFDILKRAFSTIVKSSARSNLVETYNFSKNRNVSLRYTYIDASTVEGEEKPFDPALMQKWFDAGHEDGRHVNFRTGPPPVPR